MSDADQQRRHPRLEFFAGNAEWQLAVVKKKEFAPMGQGEANPSTAMREICPLSVIAPAASRTRSARVSDFAATTMPSSSK